MEVIYECIPCRIQRTGNLTILAGSNCSECKGPMFPVRERDENIKARPNKESIEIKLSYLKELRNLADTHRFVTDGTLVERVHRVCDSIEEDLRLSGT
ncbi:hypothetical protein [Aneurinibacillus migulanus]|uniref:hypothetical protein n=1 Tax=Aneurinibacillus migulanus TaxID=47500 RepID=UPI00209C7FA0|nr:hypothetical protein [Aneurinibacillus migulanus]MCP1355457.1 hypothetical protein [Aneurinibacillus migulanus]